MRSKSAQGERAMQRLYALLGRLAPEQRRELFARSFSQQQRLCLEQFMLAARGTARPAKQAAGKRGAAVCGKPAAAGLAPKKVRGSADVPGIVRNRQKRGTYYWSEVAVGNALRLRSRAASDVSLVRHYNGILRCVREEVLREGPDAAGAKEDDAHLQFMQRFRSEIAKVPHEVGVRFVVSMKPLWSMRKLYTRTYSVAEVDEGLRAWQRLREARGHLMRQSHVLWWHPPAKLAKDRQELRAAYLESQSESQRGADGCRVSAKLDALEAEQTLRQERQLEAWNRSQMAREERRQRRAERQQRRERLAEAARERQQRSALRLIASILRRWRPDASPGHAARPEPEQGRPRQRKRAGASEGPLPTRAKK